MKKPEYAAGTTAIYRKYIDRFYAWDKSGRPGRWKIEKEDLEKLYQLYIRTELCRGYYHVRNGREMVTVREPGYKGADPEQLERIRSTYLQKDRKREICGEAEICAGKPATLRVWTAEETGRREGSGRKEAGRPVPETGGKGSPCAEGRAASELPVQEARSRALTREEIYEKLSRTGASPFSFRDLQVTTDGHAFLPVSALGELRRKALEELTEACRAEWRKGGDASLRDGSKAAKCTPLAEASRAAGRASLAEASPYLMIMVQSLGQAEAVLAWSREYAGRIELILDGEAGECGAQIRDFIRRENREIPVLAALPYVLRETDREWLRRFYDQNHDNFYGFVTRSLEELEFLIEEEYDNKVIVDSGLYVWNRESEAVLRNSVRRPENMQIVLPMELDRKELYRTFAGDEGKGEQDGLSDKILPVYGRIPLMITANCVRKTGGQCAGGRQPEGAQGAYCGLSDRKGTVFPVRTDCRHCQNVVYNSVPLSLHKFAEDPLWRGVRALLVSFTTENRQKIFEVLNVYSSLPAPEYSPEGGQQRSSELRWKDEFTNGHFKKGAE